MKSKAVPAKRTHPPVTKLPDRYATAIGHIVFKWARVEHHLFLVEKRVLGISIKKARETIQWRSATKSLRSIQDAAIKKSFVFKTNIENVKTQFSIAEDIRDTLCHSVWYSTGGALLVQVVKGKKQPKGIATGVQCEKTPLGIQITKKYLSNVLKQIEACIRISKVLLSETQTHASSDTQNHTKH